jgi:hypothetical protein
MTTVPGILKPSDAANLLEYLADEVLTMIVWQLCD